MESGRRPARELVRELNSVVESGLYTTLKRSATVQRILTDVDETNAVVRDSAQRAVDVVDALMLIDGSSHHRVDGQSLPLLLQYLDEPAQQPSVREVPL